jgi:hypothetical protein
VSAKSLVTFHRSNAQQRQVTQNKSKNKKKMFGSETTHPMALNKITEAVGGPPHVSVTCPDGNPCLWDLVHECCVVEVLT